MSVINLAALTFTDEQVRDIGQLVFEKSYVNPDLLAYLNVQTGMKSGKKVGYLGLMGDVGKTGELGCDPVASTRTAAASQITWDPGVVSDRISQCYTDLTSTAAVYARETGVQVADLTNTDWMVIVQKLLSTSMDDMRHRIVWFGDTDAANVNDSPAGTITTGVNVNLFTAIDGLWKQIFAIGTADADRYEAISRNSQASYANQLFDSTDTTNKVATKIFQDMKFNADERLVGQSDGVILATRSLCDQYKRELGNYGSLESSLITLTNGKKVLSIDGTPIISYNTWDRMIKAYFDNGTKWDKPHRAVYISAGTSLQLGLEDEGAFDEIDMFYDKKSRTNFIDFEFMIDAKIPENYLIQAAY